MKAVKSKNKRITLDDLAGIMKIGFDATASKKDLAKLEKRMTSVEEKMVSMEGGIASIREEMATKEELNKILAALDKAAKDYTKYSEEKTMRDTEIARIRKWVEQIAEKVGIELND
jgi:predicted  nucleic acid-binding Zn-ribbon protein